MVRGSVVSPAWQKQLWIPATALPNQELRSERAQTAGAQIPQEFRRESACSRWSLHPPVSRGEERGKDRAQRLRSLCLQEATRAALPGQLIGPQTETAAQD